MYTTLLRQYQLVLSARGSLFGYLERISDEHLNERLAAFNNESMLSQLLHVANCYVFWLAKTARQDPRAEFAGNDFKNLSSIKQTFGQVDLVMNDFLHHFSDSLNEQQVLTRPDGSRLTRSPFEIFTHVITHEFHHKGQVVSMSRQLGYTPVDTDVVRE